MYLYILLWPVVLYRTIYMVIIMVISLAVKIIMIKCKTLCCKDEKSIGNSNSNMDDNNRSSSNND